MDAALGSKQRSPLLNRSSRQVHTISDRFSMANTYLINDEHIIIVDPGSELNGHLILSYLQQYLHRSPADLDLIVLTHFPPDHMEGIEFLRRTGSIPVAVSAIAQQHLDFFPAHYINQMKMVDAWLEDVAGLPQHPDWRVIASPGHTPESLCLYNPFTYELLCGDILITMEREAPLLYRAANRRQLEETIRTLRSLQVFYLYPGHSRPILARRPLSNISATW